MSDIEDGDDVQFFDFKPSFVLIGIDTHESMFVKNENGDTPFFTAISACYEIADHLLVETNKRNWSQFAIVLADEEAKASLLDFQNNILDAFKILKEKIDVKYKDLKELHMRKGVFDLASFFLLCKKKFTSINSNYYQRTMIYITNDDNPVTGDSRKRFAAINEVKSFQSSDISFQLVTTRHDFKYELFYNELFSVINNPPVEVVVDDKEGLVEKLKSVIIGSFSSTQLNFYPIKTDRTRYLPIIQKDIVKSKHLFNNARMDRNTGKFVKRTVKSEGEPSNKFILKHHNDIIFNLEERAEVRKSNIPVGLTLIHVSKRLTDIGYALGKAAFIEFNEQATDHAAECRDLFSQFWQYCYKNDRVLVCARKLRPQDTVRFVELIPKFAFNRKLFLMKAIPYRNEITYVPPAESGCDEYTDEQAKAADALIDTLTREYNPSMLYNPDYSNKKAYVRAKLLDEKMEDIVDPTLNTASIDEAIKAVAEDFKNIFGLDADSNRNKRKNAGGGSRAKRAK